MTPCSLETYLQNLIQHDLKLSTMIWGPPGIGKSSIVKRLAQQQHLDFIDVRLGQLAPTDLRGLPVANAGIATWYPPEFLPRSGTGILFLDELNMAPPAMQGIAQQLILDRQVGAYHVPEGWHIWAAGNRKEDQAAVSPMPTPVANRFLHLEVTPDFESFKAYALAQALHEQIIAFLSFRPKLLHKLEAHQPAWPSPRSWEIASQLHTVDLDISPAVGAETASEFQAFVNLYKGLPNLMHILQGAGGTTPFPVEPSVRYATAIGLAVRSETAPQGLHAFRWLSQVAPPEWVQLFAVDLFRQLQRQGQLSDLTQLVQQDQSLKTFLADFQSLLTL